MDSLGQTRVIAISDASQIPLARRAAQTSARQIGLDEVQAGQVGIVAVELATNLLEHAGHGHILINEFIDSGVVELLSVDKGPGMANVAECMVDGFSTGSTPGLGLGAVRRLSRTMTTFSWPGKGTILATRFGRDETAKLPGIVCMAMPGETVCGDRWASAHRDGKDLYLLVDGLGHGHFASEAAEAVVRIFQSATSAAPAALIEQMHTPMRATRGAAIAIAAVDPERNMVNYAGIGNIAGTLERSAGRAANLVSLNGTVGHQMRRVQTFDYPWQTGDLLIMHSDGVSARWKLQDCPGLDQSAPSVVAAFLHRDFHREHDDSTVLAARLG